MKWNWIGKWLKRTRTVYKVVHREPGGQLVSIVIRKSGSRGWCELAGAFQRVYRRRDGYFPVVRQAMAFETLEQALAFSDDPGRQIWKARCERARRLRRLCGAYSLLRTFRRFAAQWGEPNGWRNGTPAPCGSLLCENLRLVKRL